MGMRIEKIEAGPLYNNVYILWCDETLEGAVIDPAGRAGHTLGIIKEHGLKILYIIYTHAHPDHVAAAAAVAAGTGAEIAAHPAAARIMRGLFMKVVSGFGAGFKTAMPSRALEDGVKLQVGRLELTVLHTPGHSRDSISIAGPGAVFTGDLLFAGSVGRSDIPGGSHKQLIESVRKKIQPLGNETEVHPGHGPSTTIGAERKTNPFLVGM